jgi:hypothetical protein
MPLSVRILSLALLAALVAGATRHVRATAARSALPTAIPAAWAPDPTWPSVWIFVRPGCPHCEAHLAALARATDRRGAHRRQELLGRIRVVGDAERVPAGVRREPDRRRRELGVHTTPITLLVEPSGHVRQAWRGARGGRAWEQALDFLEGQEVQR